MENSVDIISLLKQVLGEDIKNYAMPPKSFTIMQSEIIDFNADDKTIEISMPILDFTLNPYNSMQGGMIVVALDNAIGPLSLLTAPFNMTRHINTSYRKPITQDIKKIYIRAKLTGQKGRRLFFEADIKDASGTVYVTATAENWLVKK